MLSPQQLLASAPRRRPIRSLRQQYDLYTTDRVEHFKNQISREELLRIADEAMVDLRGGAEQQFLLTEVLAADTVDDFIKRRKLGIKGFETWRKSFPKLRAAQRDPTHWGLDASHLVSGLAPRLEPDDPVLVVGAGAEACVYLLAAHDGVVTFLDKDVGVVERAENRIAVESLSSTFEAMCVQFGQWLPTVTSKFVLVVLDAGTLAALSPGERRVLVAELQCAHGTRRPARARSRFTRHGAGRICRALRRVAAGNAAGARPAHARQRIPRRALHEAGRTREQHGTARRASLIQGGAWKSEGPADRRPF